MIEQDSLFGNWRPGIDAFDPPPPGTPSPTAPKAMTFPPPLARNSDPDTSHLAVEDAKRTANTLRARCLEAIKAAGERGLSDFELAELLGSQQTSAGKRRGELVAAGLVEKSVVDGVEQKRPAPSGSLALVWRYRQR